MIQNYNTQFKWTLCGHGHFKVLSQNPHVGTDENQDRYQ
jgi:hypothetical protein